MRSIDDWHKWLSESACLEPEAAKELSENGFVVIPGPTSDEGIAQMQIAYNRAVAKADPADVHVGKTKSSTRVDDFVNREPEFDAIYVYGPLLAACRDVIGRPFKLSSMRARTLHPDAQKEKLHVDVHYGAPGWTLIGCIVMIDDFTPENGATRFVPETHLQSLAPDEALADTTGECKNQIAACGPAGSMIIFNAYVWHGHGANTTREPRRSIQAHFVARDAQPSSEHAGRMRAETLQRISGLARYVLDV